MGLDGVTAATGQTLGGWRPSHRTLVPSLLPARHLPHLPGERAGLRVGSAVSLDYLSLSQDDRCQRHTKASECSLRARGAGPICPITDLGGSWAVCTHRPQPGSECICFQNIQHFVCSH